MGKRKTVNKGGRPEKITKEVVQKLETFLRDGCTIEFACSQAWIWARTFYLKCERDKEFMQKMEKARDYTLIQARKLVNKAITEWEDVFTARRYMEHKDQDFKKQTSIVAKTTEEWWESKKNLTVEIVGI